MYLFAAVVTIFGCSQNSQRAERCEKTLSAKQRATFHPLRHKLRGLVRVVWMEKLLVLGDQHLGRGFGGGLEVGTKGEGVWDQRKTHHERILLTFVDPNL